MNTMIETLDLSVIILTYNEELHLQRCLDNVKKIAKSIFIVDSFSSDNTSVIAEKNGALVFKNKWDNNHAKQFNWGLDNLPIDTKWVLRLDADELLTPELIEELNVKLPQLSNDVSGIIIKRRYIFLGRWIKKGIYPVKLLRIFRTGDGRCEQRWMDEHIQLDKGGTIEFQYDFVDDNLNDLHWWTIKHLNYAKREAVDLLNIEFHILGNTEAVDVSRKIGQQALVKRKTKSKYCKQPLFLRSFMYFIYRYIFKLGFCEGREGFLLHFMQGWWYRTMVDCYIYEVRRACGSDVELIKAYIIDKWKLKID